MLMKLVVLSLLVFQHVEGLKNKFNSEYKTPAEP